MRSGTGCASSAGPPCKAGCSSRRTPGSPTSTPKSSASAWTEYVTRAITDELVVGGESDPRALASRLWDLEGVAKRYQEFLIAYQDVPEALEAMRARHERLTDAEFLAGALATFVDFQEVVRHDPLLPPELLPRPWPGREARILLAKVRKLGVLAREHHDRPVLFHQFDEVLDDLS